VYPSVADGFAFREEEELYAFHPFCIFFEVGDDLTGSKVSENSSQRRRKGRSIRYRFEGLSAVDARRYVFTVIK
jgi:hypothetical protein